MQPRSLWIFIGILMLIYMGSLCYVVAAYYHLNFSKNWSFLTALAIALPIVLVEYSCSLHGNHFANEYLAFTAIDILVITICFYFVNLWLLNYFVLKHKPANAWSELAAVSLIIIAFLLTTVIK